MNQLNKKILQTNSEPKLNLSHHFNDNNNNNINNINNNLNNLINSLNNSPEKYSNVEKEIIHEMKTDKWMEDRDGKRCANCNCAFSLTNRRHHCRVCGRIFDRKVRKISSFFFKFIFL